MAVEVPDELVEIPNLAVLQNGSPLTQDESREGCWHLMQAAGEVVARWSEGEDTQETKVSLGQGNYLVFKLTGQDQNQGRRVKSPSSGSYLVMVPDNWGRDDTLSGPPPVTPESVSLIGYQAHFFELERGGSEKIAFRTPEGESVVIESKASRFELIGNRLNDASESMGPLFGESPPQIRAPDDERWKNIGTIVVGEEGSGHGRWRTQITPVTDVMEQDLPSEVAARKAGWYFLRFYDTNDELIESLDFRFLCALKEIRMPKPSPLPAQDGHSSVCVEFLHELGCAVEPVGGLTSVGIEGQAGQTILTIPPDPTSDETLWLVGSGDGPKVEVTILVERLWWAVGEEDKEPSEWEDQPFTLPRDNFAGTSKKALWLRLPRRRWVDEVLVGFEPSRADRCPIQVTRRDVAKPLRDFDTFKEIADREHEHLLKVWIEHNDEPVERVIAIVPAEQSEKKQGLHLNMISAPRLATVLTRIWKTTAGPLRVLIKEVRHKYFRRRPAHQAESVEFKRYALCIIALSLDVNPRITGLKKRWVVKARLARDEFPEIMNHLRNRHKEISASCAYPGRSICDRR